MIEKIVVGREFSGTCVINHKLSDDEFSIAEGQSSYHLHFRKLDIFIALDKDVEHGRLIASAIRTNKDNPESFKISAYIVLSAVLNMSYINHIYDNAHRKGYEEGYRHFQHLLNKLIVGPIQKVEKSK